MASVDCLALDLDVPQMAVAIKEHAAQPYEILQTMNGTFYHIMFILGSALLILSLVVAITSAKLYLGYYDSCENELYHSAESMLRTSSFIALCGSFVIVVMDPYRAANVLAAVLILGIAIFVAARRLHVRQIDSISIPDRQLRMKSVAAAFQREFIDLGLTRSQAFAVCCFCIMLITDLFLLIVVYGTRR